MRSPKYICLGFLLTTLLSVIFTPLVRAETEEESPPAPVKKKKIKKKKTEYTEDLGIGLGFLTLLPPYPSVHIAFNPSLNLNFGMEYGYVKFGTEDFSFNSTYYGIDFKYGLLGKKMFFGFGYGIRTINVEDPEEISIKTATENSTLEEVSTLTWTSKVSQQLFTPQIGTVFLRNKGLIVTGSVGLAVPIGSKQETIHEPDLMAGISADEMQDKEDKEDKKIKKYTDILLPLFSLKFSWYFDL